MKTMVTSCLLWSLFISVSIAQTLNESFESATSKPLTDAEQQQANNYYHTGRAQKILEEECAKVGKNYDTTLGCSDDSARPGQVIKGNIGGMIEMVLPKLYAVMGTAAAAGAGGKIAMKPKVDGQVAPKEGAASSASGTEKAKTPDAGKDAKAEKDEKSDYCIYIPMGGEIIASGMQMMSENKIKESQAKNPADAQRESMYAVANTHDSRAKTATIQGGIYAATTACYAVYIAKGAVIDWKMGLKIGAAGLMSVIFFKKAANHKSYANDIRAIAKKLPGSGECNPFTQTNCFCSEPSSQTADNTNWRKVCIAAELARQAKGTGTPIPCASFDKNGEASLDAECSCKRNNTCLNGQFANSMGTIGFGGVDIADPLRLLNEMNGQLNEANVNSLANQLNAKSKKLLSNMDLSDTPNVSLDPDKTELAREINKMGLPARLAALTASQQGSDARATSPSLASLGGDYNSPTRRRSGVSYNYSTGATSSRRREGDNTFKNPLGKGEKRDAIQIDTFAQEALAAAEITKDTSKGIFDIISNRYRHSAWSRFEMDKLTNEVPTTATETAPAP